MDIICAECRTRNNYEIKDIKRTRLVNGKEYEYDTKVAICKNCNEEVYHPGILDYDIKCFNECYNIQQVNLDLDK